MCVNPHSREKDEAVCMERGCEVKSGREGWQGKADES